MRRKRSIVVARLAVAALTLAFCGRAVAESELCADPAEYCGGRIDPQCLKRVGAGAIGVSEAVAANEPCKVELDAYRACIAAAAKQCVRSAGGCSDETARQLWADLRSSDEVEDLLDFSRLCAGSPQGALAENRAARLKNAAGARAKNGAEIPPKTGSASRAKTGSASRAKTGPSVDVRAAQRELRRLGHYRGAVDGDWGPGSRGALKAFQRAEGAKADGVLDPEALAALKAAPSPKRASAPAAAPSSAAQARPLSPAAEIQAASSRDDKGAALLALAKAYYRGADGKPTDRAQSARLAERACQKGSMEGCAAIRRFYGRGDGVGVDRKKAIAYGLRACELGHGASCSDVAEVFSRGEDAPRDLARSVSLSERGCRLGDALGCHNAGVGHEEGRGVPKNLRRAAQFYTLGCRGGDGGACNNLGVIYAKGAGAPRDMTEARALFEKACRLGDSAACENAKAARRREGR